MTLSDADLAGFALGVSSVAGVLLAVLGSMLVFVRGRTATNELEGVSQVEAAANTLYEILLRDKPQAYDYLGGEPVYTDFAQLISAMAAPHAAEDIPSFISWRTQTEKVIQLSQKQEKLTRESGTLRDFHTRFVDAMRHLDRAVQFVFSSVVIQQRVAGRLKRAVISAALVVGVSIPMTLIARFQYEQGVSDTVNLILAGLLMIGIMWVIGLLLSLTRMLVMSGDALVEREAEQHVGRAALAEARSRLRRRR